jgi:hypothetical protein
MTESQVREELQKGGCLYLDYGHDVAWVSPEEDSDDKFTCQWGLAERMLHDGTLSTSKNNKVLSNTLIVYWI